MKKRLATMLIVLAMAVSGLTACGGGKKEEVPEYKRGTTTEAGWESEWMGLKFTAGEGIIMESDETMDEVMEAGSKELGSDKSDVEGSYTYEMMASDEAIGVPSALVMVEKSSLSPEEYLNQVVEQLQDDASTLQVEQDGDITDYQLGNLTFKRLQLKTSSQGVEMIQDFMICQRGDYLIEVITVGLVDQKEERDALLAGFSVLE